MPDNEDYKLFLNERFEGFSKLMRAEFINVHEKLAAIEKQTTKTNNRVSKLEEKESTHIINCPVAPKVEQIDKDLSEYRMIKKYPKVFIGIIAFSVIVFIYGFRRIIQKQDVFQVTQDGLKTQVDMINIPVKDRSGKTYLYPSGMLIDSIIKNDK